MPVKYFQLINTKMEKKYFYSSEWYKLFSHLIGEYKEIELPQEIIDYFNDDLFILPKEVHKTSEEDLQNDHLDENKVPSFPEFSSLLLRSLEELGGTVFVKINNITPKDSLWITFTKTSKCSDLEDIYLLLKGSTEIHKFLKNSDNDKDVLILKKWQDIHPGSEYRCFVYDNNLIAITQRDNRLCYEHIDRSRYKILESIKKFFKKEIRNKFPLKNYVFDIVKTTSTIKLIDFNPFDSESTIPILFTWDDIYKLIKLSDNPETDNENALEVPEFRFILEDPGYVPSVTQQYCEPQEAKDLVKLASNLSFIELLEKEYHNQINSE